MDTVASALFDSDVKVTRIVGSTAEPVPIPVVGARYKHKKRGSTYTVLAIATGQCSGNDRIENQKFVCYTNEAGQAFVRPWREFRDGRFTLLPERTHGWECDTCGERADHIVRTEKARFYCSACLPAGSITG